jgi:hypothetical protein
LRWQPIHVFNHDLKAFGVLSGVRVVSHGDSPRQRRAQTPVRREVRSLWDGISRMPFYNPNLALGKMRGHISCNTIGIMLKKN